ncbi:MAG TPA: hypothetical protein VFQ25_10000 [Ktedonobacterales bacterium]|jgi:hypothetical protein|nr:hypothetical protein [Ktedonobacterales bacterium]
MPTYTGQREQDLARRVRRMLIEQAAILQDESPDEFLWLTQHYVTEQRFFEDELGARLELRLGRWARAYWPTAPRQRELLVADVFELTARKQTAYACLIRAYRSVRLLESGDSATVFRFSELFRYVAEEGQRLSPWLSFDEAFINEALATRGEADAEDDEELVEEKPTSRSRKRSASGAAATATASRAKTTVPVRASAAQRVRANQRAFYQAFAAFERYRLIRRIGADDRQLPGEQFKLDERDFSGVYEFTDLIDRFLPPAGLVAHDDLAEGDGDEGGDA